MRPTPGLRRPLWRRLCLCVWLLLALAPPLRAAETGTSPAVVVGSKRFTESYVLAELVRLSLESAGIAAEHRPGLGNTAILEAALASASVDLYPEYTGTIVRELLHRTDAADAQAGLDQINLWLAPRGLKAAVPLGFNNSYGLALREAEAERLGLVKISDLARLGPAAAAQLRLGLSHEFLQRADGWPGLRSAYGLALASGGGLDHGLAYEALARGQVDLIDVYTTDARIGQLKLRVLQDDRAYFPRYDAVLLMRATLDPAALDAALGGRIDAATMIDLNAAVEIEGRSFEEVARSFLASVPRTRPSATPVAAAPSPPMAHSAPQRGLIDKLFAPDLARLMAQHLALVFGSLALACLTGVPLGVMAHLHPRGANSLLGVVGVLQTVPSLALLAVLIALVGRIGFVPALLALWIYALLPIVRNTHAGLTGVPPGLKAAAVALGLRPGQVLRELSLPLAAPMVWAGLKTAATLNVGTATVAAFIGAGGLGERIVSGLAVNDADQMLAGALPAAGLALAVQALFEAIERKVAPRR